MPQLGETVTEGKIISWQRSVGDTIAPGDVLFEIETDKVSMEVPATSAGSIVDIRVKAGEIAPVGAVVAVIMGDAEKGRPAPIERLASTAPATAPGASTAPKTPPAAKRELDPFNAVRTPERNFGPAALPNGVRTGPHARRLAYEAGIDLATINGSGPQGRINARDIRDAATAGRGKLKSVAAPTPVQTPMGATLAQIKAIYEDAPFVEVELDGMRRTIARRLVESKQTVPHFYLIADIDIEKLLDIRRNINAALPFKVSINDFVVKAFAMALIRVPLANAVWAEDRILRFTRADVGVAVAIEGGLLTPVVRNADSKSLATIAAEIRDLAQRARDRKLKPREYQGGSASVSNLGMYGVRQFSAIINPPHSAILAVGAGERRAVETADGGIRFSTQMTVTLSCDHRVIDGALGAELLAAFKKILEEPILVLI